MCRNLTLAYDTGCSSKLVAPGRRVLLHRLAVVSHESCVKPQVLYAWSGIVPWAREQLSEAPHGRTHKIHFAFQCRD